MLILIVLVFFTSVVYCFPVDVSRKIDANSGFNDFENLIPRYDSFSEFDFPTNELEDDFRAMRKNGTTSETKSSEPSPKRNSSTLSSTEVPEISLTQNSTLIQSTTLMKEENKTKSNDTVNLDILVKKNFTEFVQPNRLPRQELNETEDDPEFTSKEKESQEDEEEDGNMVTGLISAFLGGLSRPDGSIDLEAIVGLLGSLSTQNDDGTYNFQGLTDLLRGFFGGGDGEGGSDIGAFVGGLLGAVIKGIANPPGAKGAGILAGNIFNGVLPGLSGPPDTDMMDMAPGKKLPGLDVGGFLGSLLKTVLGGSSGGMNQGGGGGSKFTFIKTIISIISSIFSASSKKYDP